MILRGFGLGGEVLTCIEQILTHLSAALGYFSWTVVSEPEVLRGLWRFDGDVDRVPFLVVIPNKPEAARTAYGIEGQKMRVDVSTVLRVDSDENPSVVGEQVLGEMIQAAFSNVPSGAVSYEYLGGGIDRYPEWAVDIMTVGVSLGVAWDVKPGNPNLCI